MRPFLGQHRLSRTTVIVVVVAAVALVAAGVVLAVALTRPAPLTIRNVRIPVVDGPRGNQHVVLDASFFLPPGGGKVPAVLLAHGFGETKDDVRPQAEDLARAGFAVLTWSARGFGTSTGQIGLDSPAYEVKDVEQLVSWLARQPRVLLDHPGDPRVGITGASYGGGISLLAAAYDHRIDAVIAQSTWNNLATALFPNGAGDGPANGVFKRQWAGLLFTQGSVGFGATAQGSAPGQAVGLGQGGGAGLVLPPGAARRSALCGRFQPQICAIYQQFAAAGRPTPQAISLLLRSSPASVAGRMRAPTLLIQGENDSLFGLDQADANYRALRRNGAPVDMVWFAGGHDGGDQENARVESLTTQWLRRWLAPGHPPASAGTGQPTFAVTRVLGYDPSTDHASLGIATASSYPGLAGTRRTLVRLAGPPQVVVSPAGGAPASISVFPGLGPLGPAGLTFDMPGQSAAFTSAPLSSSIQLTGSPTVRIRISGASEVTLFAKIYDVDQAGNATLPDQLVSPVRVTGARGGRVVTIALPAIDYDFSAGHRIRLVLTTTDYAYATPSSPAVYRVALAGPGVTMPQDPALTVVNGGAPWWVWAAPAAALVAAALILTLGRRRCRSDFVPELAGVPLEITGLTKRFRDGQLAVDDLSLRVERGQILGVLGP
ncbi:MAG TPA: alpha/beta fold hydrolase, partial [Streptosporangiaceae bacterium]